MKQYEFEYLSEVKLKGDSRTNEFCATVELNIGESIVVEKKGRGIFLGRIINKVSVDKYTETGYAYIGSAGDAVAAYIDTIEKAKRKEELGKQMEAKFKEIDKERKFEYYATLDEDFKALYEAYKGL